MLSTSSSTEKAEGKQKENVQQGTRENLESARAMPTTGEIATHDKVSHVERFETSITREVQSASRTRTELDTARRLSSERNPRAITGSSAPENYLTNRSRTRSPEQTRYSTGQLLYCVPEDAEMSLEPNSRGRHTSRLSFSSQRYYGSVSVGPGYPASLEMEEVGDLDEGEEDVIVDEELAKNGLYRGTYRNMMCLYTFVPLTTLFTFVILVLLPILAFHSSAASTFPYPPYLPFPLPEFFTAAALWCLSYLLRDILHEMSVFLTLWIPFSAPVFPSFLPSLLSNILQNSSELLLRQLAVPILLVPFYSSSKPYLGQRDELLHTHRGFPTWEDVAFKRVWWIALGWAAAEATLGIKQGYENISLYKEVLVVVRKEVADPEPGDLVPSSPVEPTTNRPSPAQRDFEDGRVSLAVREAQNKTAEFSGRGEPSRSLSPLDVSVRGNEDYRVSPVAGEREPLLSVNPPHPTLDSPVIARSPVADMGRRNVEDEVEQDLQELVHIKTREELEELYGMPVIRIPVFISCLHRINCILSSLSACLILTAAYLHSTFAYDYSSPAGSLPPKPSILRPPFFPSFYPSLIENPPEIPHVFVPSDSELFLSFSILLSVQILFSFMHTPWILPRLGVHTFVYIGFLVWLGIFFAALGFWEVLT